MPEAKLPRWAEKLCGAAAGSAEKLYFTTLARSSRRDYFAGLQDWPIGSRGF
jgi:hypothetical protein